MPVTDPRRTRQRAMISAYLDQTAEFQTAQQIYDHFHQAGDQVSLPTVYRTLTAMAETGEVDVLTTGDQSKYRRCSATHHHHLVCRSCGKTIEIDDGPFEAWVHDVAKNYDFTAVTHITEFTGLCPRCSQEWAARSD